MSATQRYQDAPANASTDLAVGPPNEDLESHAALATKHLRKWSQKQSISDSRVPSRVRGEECHRECRQHHGVEVHHRAFDLGLFEIETKTLAVLEVTQCV
jgi:hypothetical protein